MSVISTPNNLAILQQWARRTSTREALSTICVEFSRLQLGLEPRVKVEGAEPAGLEISCAKVGYHCNLYFNADNGIFIDSLKGVDPYEINTDDLKYMVRLAEYIEESSKKICKLEDAYGQETNTANTKYIDASYSSKDLRNANQEIWHLL